jgi:hypothetical protein
MHVLSLRKPDEITGRLYKAVYEKLKINSLLRDLPFVNRAYNKNSYPRYAQARESFSPAVLNDLMKLAMR